MFVCLLLNYGACADDTPADIMIETITKQVLQRADLKTVTAKTIIADVAAIAGMSAKDRLLRSTVKAVITHTWPLRQVTQVGPQDESAYLRQPH